jgi:hypothetical protein
LEQNNEVFHNSSTIKLQAQQLLANSIFNGAIPFAFVENTAFLQFLHIVAPQFVPPSAKHVGGPLLNNKYNTVQEEVTVVLKAAEGVTLFIDGSSNGCQDPITHVVASADNTPIFLKEVLHLDEAHTSERMLEIASECVSELATIGVETRGLITDNEEKMKKLRQDFYNKFNTPDHVVSCPGDPPHAIQLIIGEVLPDVLPH